MRRGRCIRHSSSGNSDSEFDAFEQETELQLLRALSIRRFRWTSRSYMSTHHSKNTPASHINRFYTTYDQIAERRLDGLIITGAPVEHLPFEEVTYWKELQEIMDWSECNVTSTLHICWGAQAGMYHRYGIQKHLLNKKLSGVYEHRVLNRKIPLVRGFDDRFMAPHSRYTSVDPGEVYADERLTVMADSEEAGIYLAMSENGKNIFVFGHPEYDRLTLDSEYKRDLNKGMEIEIRLLSNDDVTQRPLRNGAHTPIIFMQTG
ncbi:MAG: homoserine O-acetyltransferase/O-succinyltransferase family protein [Lachnospiraceae bacterium]